MPTSWKNTYAFVPSVAALGEAGPFVSCNSPLRRLATSRRHRMRPVPRSSAKVNRLLSSQPVRKIASSPNTGEECPGGNSVFQTTFLSGPNSTGRPFSSETPPPFGPRKRSHSPAHRDAASRETSTSTSNPKRRIVPPNPRIYRTGATEIQPSRDRQGAVRHEP